jgi:hypothetical protein
MAVRLLIDGVMAPWFKRPEAPAGARAVRLVPGRRRMFVVIGATVTRARCGRTSSRVNTSTGRIFSSSAV